MFPLFLALFSYIIINGCPLLSGCVDALVSITNQIEIQAWPCGVTRLHRCNIYNMVIAISYALMLGPLHFTHFLAILQLHLLQKVKQKVHIFNR
uniref:Secreted peptide n=1 Tax=Anopheles braziliensis TaxID=58242 RepID=A0A2M3ZLW2_9DIPT